MSIPFKSTAHFFLYEKRPSNRLHGKVTSHPFACIAVGYEPSASKLPFRVAATLCHPKDSMVRSVGARKAIGLLQSASEGKHAHSAWLRPSQVKNIKTVLYHLGFDVALANRFKATNKPEWTRGNKSFKFVLADVQGIRVNEKPVDRRLAQVRATMKMVQAKA